MISSSLWLEEWYVRPAYLDPVYGVANAFVLGFQAVNHRLFLVEAEDARLLAAVLGLRGEGSYLKESEAEIVHLVDAVAVGVESACKADGIAEIKPEQPAVQRRMVVAMGQADQITQRKTA